MFQMDAASTIIGYIVSGLLILSAVLGVLRGVWKLSQSQATQTQATMRNTEATRELSTQLNKLDVTLVDHEKRITRLEYRDKTS